MSFESSGNIHLSEVVVLPSITEASIVPYSISSYQASSSVFSTDQADEEMKKLSVMVPKSLHRQLRLHSAASDATITDIVISALTSYFNLQ